jgi:hypothetical protein
VRRPRRTPIPAPVRRHERQDDHRAGVWTQARRMLDLTVSIEHVIVDDRGEQRALRGSLGMDKYQVRK